MHLSKGKVGNGRVFIRGSSECRLGIRNRRGWRYLARDWVVCPPWLYLSLPLFRLHHK